MNNNRYDYEFEPDRLHPHELAVLGSGRCGSFFPTTFVFGSNRVTAVYSCDGFAPLSGFRIEQTSDILYILEKILLILRMAPEHLLIPERILILPQTVFYRQETGEIKLTYIPTVGEPDLHRNIAEFLLRIQTDLCDPFRSFLDRFTRRSCEENLDINSMLTLVAVLRRELDERLSDMA